MTEEPERPAWLDEMRAEWEAWFEEQKAESRRYLDGVFERHARINAEMIAGLQEFGARMAAEIDDQRQQIQANTEAVLRMLDRLGPEPT